MTRRLGGIGSKNLAAMASLSLAATLAGGFAITGCGGDNNPSTMEDAGDGGADVIVVDRTPPPDGTMNEASDAPVDRGMDVAMETSPDVTTPPPDAGMDVMVMAQCGTPTITPNGGSIPIGQNVTITPAMGFPMGGFIFYTTDGTLPTHTSPLYSGPIQVTQNETIHAIAFAQGTCTDSMLASASFTVTPVEAGSLQTPVFNPQSQVRNNDFLLGLSGTAGSTICYTLDGVTMPTCTVTASTATCAGNSQTYNAATQISITGSITNTTDPMKVGQVMVQAIACEAGSSTTSVSSQTYTLQAASPTMVSPAPGALMYKSGGYSPTISSATTSATIQITTDGTSMPTCGVASPGTAAANPSTVAVSANEVINAIACKTGYAPSAMPDTLTYTVQLNAPVLQAAATSDSTFTPTVTDTANAGSSDTKCFTTDGSTPACNAMATGCTGTGVTSAPSITANNTTVMAIACKAGLTTSGVATGGPYMLQLSPPGLTQPGFNGTTGLPTTSYRIPVMGFAAPVVGQSTPTGTTPASYSTTNGFTCVVDNGATGTMMPACGTNMCTTGTQLAVGAALPSVPAPTTTAADAWAIIACPTATGTRAAFAPSAVTTVTYSAASGALAPSITPASAGPYTTPIQPQIANTDSTTMTICYTTDGITAPTCSNAVCTSGGSTTQVTGVAGAGAASLTFSVTAGGTGYSSSTPPVVSVSGGGGTCTGIAATVAAGAVTGITGAGTCTGFTTAPTVSFTGGGGSGAAASAVPTDVVVIAAIGNNNTTVQAVACSTAFTQTAATPRTYNFAIAEPDFTLVQTTQTTGDLNGGGSGLVGAGQQIKLSSASNFTGFGTETIHYTTDGSTANCSTGTVVSSPTNITVPSTASYTLSAIGCGTNQSSSTARTAMFTIGAATPVITNQVTGSPTGSLTWERTFSTIITSATGAGTPICYTTDGSTPTCSGGTCGGSATTIPATSPATVMVTTGGMQVRAVACTSTLGQSGTASANYTLNISNVVFSPNPATCAAAANIGLDQSTTATNLGGPTDNACVCYTTDGTAAVLASNIATCTTPASGTGTCFLSGNAGATTSATAALDVTTALSVVTAKAGFTAAATVPTSIPFTAYSRAISTIDGVLQGGEWSNTDNLVGGTVGVSAYVSHDASNLYVAVTGYTAAAGTDVVVFFGANNTGGTTAAPSAFGTYTIPFSAKWALSWASNGSQGTAVTAYAYTTSWASTTLTGATAGYTSGATVEFSVPLSDFGPPSTLDVSGSIVTGVGTAGAATTNTWPSLGGGMGQRVADTLASCEAPAAEVTNAAGP